MQRRRGLQLPSRGLFLLLLTRPELARPPLGICFRCCTVAHKLLHLGRGYREGIFLGLSKLLESLCLFADSLLRGLQTSSFGLQLRHTLLFLGHEDITTALC